MTGLGASAIGAEMTALVVRLIADGKVARRARPDPAAASLHVFGVSILELLPAVAVMRRGDGWMTRRRAIRRFRRQLNDLPVSVVRTRAGETTYELGRRGG